MNVDSTFNGCDHWNPYICEVFQYLNAFVVHLVPSAGIGDIAEACKIEVNTDLPTCSRHDYNLVRPILRDPVKGIDKLRMVLRGENERPAVAVKFDNQHTVGISRQLQAAIGSEVVSLSCLHSILLLRGGGAVPRNTQMAVRPPSTASFAPLMKLARSVAKKTMASAISSAVAGRPAGAWAASCSSPCPMASVPSVRVGPGLTVLTRTPLGPYSAAQALVSRLMAALLEP